MSAAQMPRLSMRLTAAADLVTEGSRVADIGTDHAWLPISLCLQGKIPSAVAMDLREGPLEAAAGHVHAFGLDSRIELRKSDGLRELRPEEADAVLITGMGGRLICRILEEAGDRLSGVCELILGPQSDQETVRRMLSVCGFRIAEERLICEEGKYYPLIRAVPAGEEAVVLTEEEAAYGPDLLRRKDDVLREWLMKEKERIGTILNGLEENPGDKAGRRAAELKKEERRIDSALDRYEM